MNVMSAEGLPRVEGDPRVTRLVNDSGYRAFVTDRLVRQAQLLRHALDQAGMPDSLRTSIQTEAETLAEAMDADAHHVLPRAAAIELALDVGAELDLPHLSLVELELAAVFAEIGRFGA